MRSTTGANIRNIELLVKERLTLESLAGSLHRIVKNLHFKEIPEEETWRIAAMKEIVWIKLGYVKVEDFTEEMIDEILRFICSE